MDAADLIKTLSTTSTKGHWIAHGIMSLVILLLGAVIAIIILASRGAVDMGSFQWIVSGLQSPQIHDHEELDEHIEELDTLCDDLEHMFPGITR